MYVVDFAQATLEPLPDLGAHADVPQSEPVATSMAGRAFVGGVPAVSPRGPGYRVWVPVVEGSDRTGVLGLTVPEATEEIVAAAEELGLLAGHLIATHARTTDLYNLHRRRRALSLAASMQWDLLPPLVFRTPAVTIAGILEPAYDVGGDCFDYALNAEVLSLAIFDAVGHGVESSLVAALASAPTATIGVKVARSNRPTPTSTRRSCSTSPGWPSPPASSSRSMSTPVC